MPVSRLRLLAIAAGLSLTLGAGGFAREVARFGWNDASGIAYVQRELIRRIAGRTRSLQTLADRAARDADLVDAAAASRDRLPALFASLSRLPSDESLSSTVWVPHGPAGGYRVLAWSDGPGEDVPPDLLSRAPALTAAQGAGGLRLVLVRPIERGDRRIGVAAAETVIAANALDAASPRTFLSPSIIGPIPAVPAGTVGTLPGSLPRVRIDGPSGTPLLEVAIDPAQLTAARRVFRWRTAALALLPWVVCLLASAAVSVDRRRAVGRAVAWVRWSAAASILIVAAAGLVIWLARHAAVSQAWVQAVQAVAAFALVAVVPGSAWWRRWPRPDTRTSAVRWVTENLAGGAVVAAGLVMMAGIWRDRINSTSIENWQLPMLATDATSLAALTAVLVSQIAVSWTVASTLGILAARWRVSAARLRGWTTAIFWVLPSVALLWLPDPAASVPLPAGFLVTASAAAFGLASTAIRRQYRSTSEARRLVLRFAALFVPVIVVYPLAAASADLATRDVIERDYGPATLAAQEPSALRAVLTTAEQEVDRIPELEALLAPSPSGVVPSEAAFTVWTHTILSRNRITSELELYGEDRRLVSRFSLNVPEFGALYQTGRTVWQGTGCDWAAFVEVARFGAQEQDMLHAERAVCAPDGRVLGAVVLHLIPDYRALPFVSTANPYYEALGGTQRPRAGSRIADLQLVVYGWSLHPVFVSGRVAWPIDQEIDGLLEQSRIPFWRDREFGGRLFHIYFLNDRARVYAIGYPSPTALQHVTRLAEAAAVLLGLFFAYLLATTLLAPLRRSRPAALRKLFHEIRASFYRKLFLFFVLAAVGPVVLFAIAFGAYMTAKLRADVESEAGSVVIVARRVFDELSAAQARPDQGRLGATDDVMVWIRQMVDQDVNLFEGPQLIATSQRDLFDSGLLPTRTPASVYRDVILDRRPVSVAEDRIGDLRYLVAAAPLGRDAVITVPLALRQREIEHEIDELTRGVLAGTVLLIVFAAALGASVAARVSDPVARLTRATRLIAAGRLDERLVADTEDELGRLVEDFNSMTETLVAQRAELARANQLKAWAEMSRQVAHEVKNPLTPIQLAAEHLQRVHDDQGRPMGEVLDQCLTTILKQVRLLRRIASEFSTFATQPLARIESVRVGTLIESVLEPYRAGLPATVTLTVNLERGLPPARCDRTQTARALTNLIENALQAMPNGGELRVSAGAAPGAVAIQVRDTGVGMDEEGVRRAFEPYFSTKTGGSGLGLANAKRSVESFGGTVTLESARGRGTTVTITLPAELPGAPASAPPPSR